MHPFQAHEAKVAHFYFFSLVSFSIALHRIKNPGLWSQATGFNSSSTLVKPLSLCIPQFSNLFLKNEDNSSTYITRSVIIELILDKNQAWNVVNTKCLFISK